MSFSGHVVRCEDCGKEFFSRSPRTTGLYCGEHREVRRVEMKKKARRVQKMKEKLRRQSRNGEMERVVIDAMADMMLPEGRSVCTQCEFLGWCEWVVRDIRIMDHPACFAESTRYEEWCERGSRRVKGPGWRVEERVEKIIYEESVCVEAVCGD